MLNGQPMGGKRRSAYHFDLWCLKYLPKFEWEALTEEIGGCMRDSCRGPPDDIYHSKSHVCLLISSPIAKLYLIDVDDEYSCNVQHTSEQYTTRSLQWKSRRQSGSAISTCPALTGQRAWLPSNSASSTAQQRQRRYQWHHRRSLLRQRAGSRRECGGTGSGGPRQTAWGQVPQRCRRACYL